MSDEISDALREWADHQSRCGTLCGSREAVLAIADRIDEAHERATLAQYNKGTEVATKQLIAEKTDEWLADYGLVRLPVDADGVPWHVGDMASFGKERPHKVLAMRLEEGKWTLDLEGDYEHVALGNVVHHKPTPAERIRKIVGKMQREPDIAKVRAECPRLLDIADELEGEGHE